MIKLKSLRENKKIINEDETTDLQSTVTSPYEKFVAQLGSNAQDAKVQALLKKGTEDGKPADEVITLKDTAIAVQDLKPTQNEIALDKSLNFPLTNVNSAEDCLKGGVVAIAGKRIVTAKNQYIIDGHHRWSQLYAMNKDASIAVTDMDSKAVAKPIDFLKVTQLAIAADLGTVPSATAEGSKNLITIAEADLKKHVIDTITDAVLEVFKKYKKGDTKEAVADYIWSNVLQMQKTSKPVSGAPKRDVMPQTDNATNWKDIVKTGELNFMPPFTQESVNKTFENKLFESVLKHSISEFKKATKRKK